MSNDPVVAKFITTIARACKSRSEKLVPQLNFVVNPVIRALRLRILIAMVMPALNTVDSSLALSK
jgi:hypothetical protein